MRETILAQEIYCAKSNPETESQSGSCIHPQGTWDLSSTEHLGVRPRSRDCNLAVNPTFNVQNGFFRFRGYESTRSDEYDLGLLTQHPIN